MTSLVFWGGVAVAVVLGAELTGARGGVYAGAAGGMVLSLIGMWFSGRTMAAEPMAEDGRKNAWTWWGLGLLVRFLALAMLIFAYRFVWDASGVMVPALSMAGVYLAWLFFEVCRLYLGAESRGGERG